METKGYTLLRSNISFQTRQHIKVKRSHDWLAKSADGGCIHKLYTNTIKKKSCSYVQE